MRNGDVRCPNCLEEFEHKETASAGELLVDHLVDDHDQFSIDVEDTCPFCATEFEIGAGGVSAGDKLADHLTDDHQDVFSHAVTVGLAGGR